MRFMLLFMTMFVMLACQLLPMQAILQPTISATTQNSAVTVTPAGKLESPSPAPLQPVAAVSERPFSPAEVLNQAPIEKYAGLNVFLPFNLEKAQNMDVLADLTPAHLEQLEQNGFTLLQTQEEQFYEIRERVAIWHGQPYFLTTDAAYHALHLEFDALLKALEREHLRPKIIRITQALLEEVLTYNRQVEGSPWQKILRWQSPTLPWR